MTPANPSHSARDERVDQLIAAYLKSVEQGQPLDREELLTQHSDLATDLAAFFADRDRFEQAAGPLRAGADMPTEDSFAPRATGPGTKIRYFGDYELLEEIARGGMGVVYKARQVNLKRIVALKLILAGQLAGPQEVERFHAEAEAAAKLDHPGIVPIFEIGEHEGQHYFSMAFVDGESLAHRVAQGVIDPREAAELMKRVGEAIAYAHVEGVIHRDLKPGNILLDKDGTPRVTDFGLAKRVEGESPGLTATGQVLGTPSYMPPEQAQGDNARIGPLADVYSLGAVLYCLLTGRPPFQAASAVDTLLQVVTQEPVSARQLNPAVPRDLETICAKCLEKEVRRRYSSATELAQELNRFLNGEPIHARPIGVPARAWRWCKRNPVVASLAGVVASLLLAVTIVSMVAAIRLDQSATRERDAAQEARVAQKDAEHSAAQARAAQHGERREREAAERTLYFNRIATADMSWHNNEVGRAEELLDLCPAEMRHWEWGFLKRQCHRDLLTLPGRCMAFSPDGKRIASASDSTVKVWDAQTGALVHTLRGHTLGVGGLAFSTDGTRIASASGDKTVKVWDAQTGAESLTLQGHQAAVRSVAFSPDGKHIASASEEDKTARVWDAQTGTETHTLRLKGYYVLDVAFSPDSNRIAVASGYEVMVRDAQTGTEGISLRGHAGPVHGVTFSPDGKRIASASWDKTAKVWDAQTGTEILTFRGHTSLVNGVAFSADGKRIASASMDKTVKVWDAQTGTETLTLRGHTDIVRSVAFSGDGLRIVSAGVGVDNAVKIWDAKLGTEVLTLRGHTTNVYRVAFSPDGNRIASASADRMVKVWDAQTGTESLTLEGHTTAVFGVAFSPDGKRIGSGSSDKTVKLWDAQAGTELLTMRGHTEGIEGVAFSPDGKRIASASVDKTVKVWDTQTGHEALTLRGHTDYVRSVGFSPDGKRIASASGDRTVKVWDAQTGSETLTVRGHAGDVFSVAFSPDSKRIASASVDNTVKVWDAQTGAAVLTLRGHTSQVSSVAFSPDGKRIVSAGLLDKTVKLWDAQTGVEALTLRGHTDAIESVAFSPDGKRIASAGDDNAVTVWEAYTAGTALAPSGQTAPAQVPNEPKSP